MGTPAYMAPEQARGEVEKLGPRSDVYSMGAMLYHLLARHAPYLGTGARIGNRTAAGHGAPGSARLAHERALRPAAGAGRDLREGDGARGRAALRGHARAGRGPARVPRAPGGGRVRDGDLGRDAQVGAAQPRAGGFAGDGGAAARRGTDDESRVQGARGREGADRDAEDERCALALGDPGAEGVGGPRGRALAGRSGERAEVRSVAGGCARPDRGPGRGSCARNCSPSEPCRPRGEARGDPPAREAAHGRGDRGGSQGEPELRGVGEGARTEPLAAADAL